MGSDQGEGEGYGHSCRVTITVMVAVTVTVSVTVRVKGFATPKGDQCCHKQDWVEEWDWCDSLGLELCWGHACLRRRGVVVIRALRRRFRNE